MNFHKPLLISTIILFAGCTSTPAEDTTDQAPTRQAADKSPNTPQPQRVRMKIPDAPPNLATGQPPTVQKNLFNVLAIGEKLYANDVPVKNLEALKTLLAQYDKPVVTLSVHRCVDSVLAKNLLESIQPLTDTPIAYTAFGSYSDESCAL